MPLKRVSFEDEQFGSVHWLSRLVTSVRTHLHHLSFCW
jgi:hypothetical protein